MKLGRRVHFGANMEDLDLRGADLRGQDLRCVRFYLSSLQGADLRGANLAGADLRWVDLRNAKLDGANLEGARRGTQGGVDLQIPGWENDNGILCRKKTVHKLRVWGRDEKNSEGEFDYSCDVPPELDQKLYWLIAQGLLFERNWCDDGLTWKVSVNGKELT